MAEWTNQSNGQENVNSPNNLVTIYLAVDHNGGGINHFTYAVV